MAALLLCFSVTISDYHSHCHCQALLETNEDIVDAFAGSIEQSLDWKKRFKVVLGIAEGLKYLHHECPRRIIHRDIKASNILLTEDYQAQVLPTCTHIIIFHSIASHWHFVYRYPISVLRNGSRRTGNTMLSTPSKEHSGNTIHCVLISSLNFGHHTHNVAFRYLAPEYFMQGIVDEKTDVFAFGVLLLEILTGRRAVDSSSRQSLVIWVHLLHLKHHQNTIHKYTNSIPLSCNRQNHFLNQIM